MWHNKFKSLVLLISLAGVGFFAFADNNDLTIKVKITDGVAVPQLQVYSMSPSHGSRTFNSAEVFDGAQLFYDRRTDTTNYSIIRITDKLPNCTFTSGPNTGSAEIPLTTQALTAEISGGGQKCVLIEAPISELESLTMNFYVQGVSAERPAEFVVHQFNASHGPIGSDKSYDDFTQDHWYVPQAHTQEMVAGYDYATISLHIDEADIVCHFGDDLTNDAIGVSKVDVVADLTGTDNSCILHTNYIPPEPEQTLEMSLYAHGITGATSVLRVSEYKDSNSSALTTEYNIGRDYDYLSAPWKQSQVLNEDFGAYSKIAMIVNGSEDICYFSGTNNSEIEKTRKQIYIDFDMNRAGSTPACLLYTDGFPDVIANNIDLTLDLNTDSEITVRMTHFAVGGGNASEYKETFAGDTQTGDKPIEVFRGEIVSSEVAVSHSVGNYSYWCLINYNLPASAHELKLTVTGLGYDTVCKLEQK